MSVACPSAADTSPATRTTADAETIRSRRNPPNGLEGGSDLGGPGRQDASLVRGPDPDHQTGGDQAQ